MNTVLALREPRLAAATALLEGAVPHLTRVNGLAPTSVEKAVGGFLDFLAHNPSSVIDDWKIVTPRDPEDPAADDGFVRKDETDRKIYFHFRPDLETLLFRQRDIRLTPAEEAWFAACLDIHQACSRALLELAQEMDELRPGYDLAERARRGAWLNVLRIMRYDAGYETIGRMHTDRNAMSFHIAESHPGFETVHGFETKHWTSPHPPQVLAFTGKNLERITRGAVRALWHGAKDQRASSEPRWVMVFFGHLARDANMY